MIWSSFGNDHEADCCIAACANAITLWTGIPPSQESVDAANNRFGGLDSYSKPLLGWFLHGIDGNHLGGFARLQPSEIGAAVKRFGCAYVGLNSFEGVSRHCVLQISGAVVSWGCVYLMDGPLDIAEAYAIAPRFHPILVWYALKNNPIYWTAAIPLVPLLWWLL